MDDTRDFERELELLMSYEAATAKRTPEVLMFLARALGEAIDQAQEDGPRDDRRKN